MGCIEEEEKVGERGDGRDTSSLGDTLSCHDECSKLLVEVVNIP